MRTEALGLLLMAAMAANAEADRINTIAIHIQNSPKADLLLLRRAEGIADAMFRSAGIQAVWKIGTPRLYDPCCATVLVIQLTTSTPSNFLPTVLAHAFPYQNTSREISVFYDRIIAIRRRPEAVLAHVMVHEVTHMLQGMARHSESGLMKAFWTKDDYTQMARALLAFTPADIELIHLGLERRIAGQLR